jgi:Chaperone of endosialidase
MKNRRTVFTTILVVCFGLLPTARAVVPPPDGGYPGFNTAEGQKALFSLTTGVANTGVGWSSLFSNTDGSFNTAVGAGTLLFNVGNQSKGDGVQNTAIGTAALLFNTVGFNNAAVGTAALLNNTEGNANTATGSFALSANITGTSNTASGFGALQSNTTGMSNTANGVSALSDNTTGNGNTANGISALLSNTTGALNTAVGAGAGANITGNGNVCIGQGVLGEAAVDDTTYIRNVYNSQATARIVYVNSNNKIGTLSSSRRYKEDVTSMDKASEALFALNPVTFRYKKEIDQTRALSYGLIAEEVAEITADLITRDRDGKPETVRYEMVNAMLLNEFLKEHRKVKKLEATVLEQQRQIKALTSGLENVSAQLGVNRAPRVAETTY